MFEAIKKLFKKEEESIVIEMSEEDIKKAEEYAAIAVEAREKGEVSEARNATGKLLGFVSPYGFEEVDDQYEIREMLYKVLEKLDRIEAVLNIENNGEK